jgi:hypothetical protein
MKWLNLSFPIDRFILLEISSDLKKKVKKKKEKKNVTKNKFMAWKQNYIWTSTQSELIWTIYWRWSKQLIKRNTIGTNE